MEAYTGIVGAHCVPPPHYERRAVFERARTMLRMRFIYEWKAYRIPMRNEMGAIY